MQLMGVTIQPGVNYVIARDLIPVTDPSRSEHGPVPVTEEWEVLGSSVWSHHFTDFMDRRNDYTHQQLFPPVYGLWVRFMWGLCVCTLQNASTESHLVLFCEFGLYRLHIMKQLTVGTHVRKNKGTSVYLKKDPDVLVQEYMLHLTTLIVGIWKYKLYSLSDSMLIWLHDGNVENWCHQVETIASEG